jgi:hypothetical protein
VSLVGPGSGAGLPERLELTGGAVEAVKRSVEVRRQRAERLDPVAQCNVVVLVFAPPGPQQGRKPRAELVAEPEPVAGVELGWKGQYGQGGGFAHGKPPMKGVSRCY